MGLKDWLFPQPTVEESRNTQITLAQLADALTSFSYNGTRYTLPGATQEDVGGDFVNVVRGAFKSDGVVFACVLARMSLFSEARFMFRRLRGGRPGDLFGNQDLELLNRPWHGATTGDLLSRMLVYNDLAGNAYVVRRQNMLTPLRPDWVTIIGGTPGGASVWHPDAKVLGYAYQEGGPGSGNDPMVFLPEEVAHFSMLPDPEARFRGMSWLTPIVREVMADKAATDHKLAFFENGATPNLLVKLPIEDLQKVQAIIDKFKETHEGVANAYKTLFLAGGADATVVGADLQQLDFKATQGAGETRIAAAAGVPPVVVGLSEGLQGSSLNAGNYKASFRRFSDLTMRPLWRNACGALSTVTRVPGDAELWYDERDIKALQDDLIDASQTMQTDATAVKTLVEAGYTPDSAVASVAAKDMGLLVHSGLISVQLQPPGTTTNPGSSDQGETQP